MSFEGVASLSSTSRLSCLWAAGGKLFVALMLVLVGCQDASAPESDPTLRAIQKGGTLKVLTRNAPTTYYIERGTRKGPEYELARRFAEELGVELKLIVIDDIGRILEALANGRGHIAAAGLTRTEDRQERFAFGPVYQTVQQQVVCRRGQKVPDGPAELADRELLVLEDSSYVERLQELNGKHPELDWRATDDLATEQIMARVWQRKVDCTVADSNIVALNRRYYPELVVAFPLSEEQGLAWALPKGAEALQAKLGSWLNGLEKRKHLAALRDRYYGHVQIFDYVDIATFRRRIDSRLPKYQSAFRKVAKDYPRIDWHLLAAQAYQESHWDPRARSPTGVRGIMMLTQNTARSLGISNRLDVQASIRGGAQYLGRMMGQLPDSIEEPDRTWMALAAYNVGMGHLKDARELARRLGRDPDSWSDLKDVLPKLAQKAYYKDLRYGYARGTEPVKYVRRIRQYDQVLTRALGS